MTNARYIGTEDPAPVRVGERAIRPGDVIDGPPELVAELLDRIDFEPAPGDRTPTPAEAAYRAAMIEED